MSYAVGTYTVEYRRMAEWVAPLASFPFFSSEPSLGYFQELAQTALRAFWKTPITRFEPIKTREPVPELVRILASDGSEVFSWSLADEYQEMKTKAGHA